MQLIFRRLSVNIDDKLGRITNFHCGIGCKSSDGTSVKFIQEYFNVGIETASTITSMPFLGEPSTNWGYMMAASVVAAIPVTIIFVFLQRYFIQGLTADAIKG